MRQVVWLLGNHPWEAGTKRQYRDRHKNKWSPLLILIIMHGQDGERRDGKHSLRKRMPPCEGKNFFYDLNHMNQTLIQEYGKLAGWMNQMLTKRLMPVAKNLQSWMSVETATDARGNEFPLLRLACINACWKWNQRLQVPHESAADSINIKDCKFLVLPPILRQDLIHQHQKLQVPSGHPPCSLPATANSTAASKGDQKNLLWQLPEWEHVICELWHRVANKTFFIGLNIQNYLACK